MRLLKSSLSSVIYYGSRMVGRENRGVRILCYHNVNDKDKTYTTVSVSNFKAQMEFLRQNGYQSISLNETLAASNGSFSSKRFVITFDDGWRDNFDHAFPILKECGFSVTVFLIAGRIGEPGYLNVEQIKAMDNDGIRFGSHTLSHPNLKLLTKEQKWNEIFGSRKKLEEKFRFSVDFFCYPYGWYDHESIQAVQQAGYLGACSNRPGSNFKMNPYLLNRTEIGAGDTLFDFQKKLAGSYDLLHQGLHWFRGRP